MKMNLRGKIFSMAIIIGTIPLLIFFYINQDSLQSLKKRFEDELEKPTAYLQSAQNTNLKIRNEYEQISSGINNLTENFSQLNTNTNELLNTEIKRLDKEVLERIEAEGSLITEKVQSYINEIVFKRIQSDIDAYVKNEKNKSCQSFIKNVLSEEELEELSGKLNESFPVTDDMVYPYFEDYLDNSLLKEIENLGYKLTIYIDGAVKLSSFLDSENRYIPMPHSSNLNIKSAYEKIQGNSYYLTYKELTDQMGFEVGRVILAINIDQIEKEKDRRLDNIHEIQNVLKNISNEQNTIQKHTQKANKVISEELEIQKNIILKSIQSLKTILSEITAHNSKIRTFSIYIILLSFIAVTIFSIYISSIIIQPINKVLRGLTRNANRMLSESDEVSHTSTVLSDGAVMQSESINKTTACIENMAQATVTNTCHAYEANILMKDAQSVVEQVTESMNRLNRSIDELTETSQHTSTIIKNIDEIAFQTNLLALNASVEASRAGDFGSGFAVVANEVRSLSIRAKESATITSELIKQTVKTIEECFSIVNKTSDDFGSVSQYTEKVNSLIAKISSSSEVQNRSVKQANNAIETMRNIIAQNGAIAEKNTKASKKMRQKAFEMKNLIHYFSKTIGTDNGLKRDSSGRPGSARKLLHNPIQKNK